MSTFNEPAMSNCNTDSQDRIGNSLCEFETPSKGENRYLTVSQLAERLQISESTIYGWVDRDSIPFLMAGDLLRFDPNAIDAWMLAGADRRREKKRALHVRVVK